MKIKPIGFRTTCSSILKTLRYCLTGICFSAGAIASTTENAPTSFQAGIEAYEKGDYPVAQSKFSAILETEETPAARHNLGLTYFQLDQPAQAVWQLERALLLDPFNRDYREKRDFAREQLGLTGNPTKGYYRFSQLLATEVWFIFASISFWLLIAAIILPALNQKTGDSRIRLLRFLSLLILAFSLTALAFNRRILQTGTVLAEETTSLHAAPASAAPESGFARPGERARVLDRHNDFYQIKTEGSATGWISKDAFRPFHEIRF